MSKIEYSPNQKFAIEKIDQSLVLSAGAGAGKTGVLVQRYLQLLNEHKSHDAIVAITFTRKAAAEMRERIGYELLQRLQKEQSKNKAELLQQQILLLPTANIGTIHGFCSNILRSYPIEAGIDPNFTLLEEFESRQILANCITDQLSLFLQNHNQEAMFLLKDSNTSKLQAELGDFLSKAIGKGLNPKSLFLNQPLTSEQRQELWQKLLTIFDLFKTKTFELDKRGTNAIKRRDFLAGIELNSVSEFNRLGHKQQGQFFQDIANWFFDYEKSDGDKLSKNDTLLYEYLKELDFFNIYQNLWDDWLQVTYKKLYEFLNAVYENFSAEKKKVKALDFGDLEHLTIQLLEENPQIVSSLQERYLSYLVDEFQDTNYTQFEIIKLLNANRMRASLFVAGDIKQSIYAFRGAVAKLFLDMTEIIDQSVDENTEGHKVLQANYRSAPQIIDLVNAYFSDVLPGYEPMSKGRVLPYALPAAELLVNRKEKSGESRQEEARAMAKRIREMVDKEEKLTFKWEEGKEIAKAVKYRDIAMLFRSRSALDIYIQALKNENIPYLVIGNRAFYQREEIRFILSGLAAIAQPDDEFSAWGWLSAPFHHLFLRDLAEYALYCRQKGVSITDLFHLGSVPKRKVADRLHKMIGDLKNWQKLQMFYDVPELIERMILDSGIDTYYAGTPLGEQAWTNIQKLISIAKEASGAKYNGIHEALAYFKNLAEEENEAELTLFGENQNAVRIMTIHAAKGLEFPVLFLPDLIRKLTQRVENLLYSPTEGLTLTLGTRKGQKLKEETLNLETQEAQRVLYVALTRARDYLVIGGSISKYEKSSYWAQFLQWLMESQELPSVEAISQASDGLLMTYHDLQFLWRYYPEEYVEKEERIFPRFDKDLDLHEFLNESRDGNLDPDAQEKDSAIDNDKGLELTLFSEQDVEDLNQDDTVTFEYKKEASEVNCDRNVVALAPENITPMQKEIPLEPRKEFRVSATALLEYELCPRRYFLRYRLWLKPIETKEKLYTDDLYDRLEEEGSELEKPETVKDDPLLFGSFVHYLCENLDLNKDDEELVDEALKLEQFISQAPRRAEALNMLKRIRGDEIFVTQLKQAKNIYKEWKFLIPLSENVFLEGIIDLVLENKDGGFSILDYKTNRVNENTIEAVGNSYALQLQWYALALEERFKSKVDLAQLYFTRLPQLYPVSTTHVALKEAKSMLLSLSHAIETGRNIKDFHKKIGQHCRYCPYMQVCLNPQERREFS